MCFFIKLMLIFVILSFIGFIFEKERLLINVNNKCYFGI